ncbi:uncharacterized protein LOC132689692 isoform X1 [Panthera onca]
MRTKADHAPAHPAVGLCSLVKSLPLTLWSGKAQPAGSLSLTCSQRSDTLSEQQPEPLNGDPTWLLGPAGCRGRLAPGMSAGCHCQTLGQLSPGSSYLRVHQRRGQANRSSCTTLDFKEGNMEQEREFQTQRLAVSLERVSLVATEKPSVSLQRDG